jgi:hypothetical protein
VWSRQSSSSTVWKSALEPKYERVDKYLDSARNPRVRSLDIFAVGDVFIQTLSLVGLASAPGVVEEIEPALALIGSVAGVDDRQSRGCRRIDDSLAWAHVGSAGGGGDRGEFGVGQEWRVVCGTGAGVAAVFGRESEDVDDRSLTAVGTRLVMLGDRHDELASD